MTDDGDEDEVSAGYDRLAIILAEFISAWHDDRPDDALMLMKQAYGEFQSLPSEERKQMDEMFQLMAAELTTQPN